MASIHNNPITNKIAYQIPFFKSKEKEHRIKVPFYAIDNAPTVPFRDFLDPINPLHGGIGFTAIYQSSNPIALAVHATNYIKSNVSQKNRNVIHGCVFVNDNSVFEATARYKDYNGKNKITDEAKNNTSVYISKFPLLNVMIAQEIQDLKGGGYNFIGTLNCISKIKIFKPEKDNDFFCSQMLLKAIKNALIKYQKMPLLPNKQDVEKIAQTLSHLDPDLTMPAEIKEVLDTLPEYFTIKKFDIET